MNSNDGPTKWPTISHNQLPQMIYKYHSCFCMCVLVCAELSLPTTKTIWLVSVNRNVCCTVPNNIWSWTKFHWMEHKNQSEKHCVALSSFTDDLFEHHFITINVHLHFLLDALSYPSLKSFTDTNVTQPTQKHQKKNQMPRVWCTYSKTNRKISVKLSLFQWPFSNENYNRITVEKQGNSTFWKRATIYWHNQKSNSHNIAWTYFDRNKTQQINSINMKCSLCFKPFLL